MKHNLKSVLGLGLGLFMSSAHATPKAHTWHTVSTTQGTWTATLQMLNQSGGFIDHNGNDMSHFVVSPDNPQDYGFYFDSGADFDIAYTLTLIRNNSKNSTKFISNVCVYVVTASGVAQADVRVSQYNGANCNWTHVKGRGVSFSAD